MTVSSPMEGCAGRQPRGAGAPERSSGWRLLAVAAVLAAACSGPAAGQAVDGSGVFTMTPVEPPQQAPQIAFLDRSGHGTKLADFRGRVVVLNLWATWCVPCVSEMPALDRLASRFASEPLAVVAVALDREGKRPVDAFYRRVGLVALPQYFDPRGLIYKDLGGAGLPTTLVIDHEGREIGRLTGPVDWGSPDATRYLEPLIEHARAATSVRE